MKLSYLLGAILVMALVSHAPRIIPLLLFRKRIQSEFIQTFLTYMPYGVLAAMTFPAILSSTGNPVSALIGLAAALLLSWKRLGLLPVSLGAVAVVFLTEQLMRLF